MSEAANTTTAPFGDGGPAFSRPISSLRLDDGPKDIYDGQEGMSLRDYFAAKALTLVDSMDLSAIKGATKANGRDLVQQIAHSAYEMADAMLAARKADPMLEQRAGRNLIEWCWDLVRLRDELVKALEGVMNVARAIKDIRPMTADEIGAMNAAHAAIAAAEKKGTPQ